jgi:predicted small lipoprotein YifL
MRIHWIAIFVSAFILSACGQKGPLYLPQDAGQTIVDNHAEVPAIIQQAPQH